MNYQEPAKGISQVGDYGNAKSYHVDCSCTSPDHALSMWIEVTGDEDVKDVELTFYGTFYTSSKLIGSVKERLKLAWTILTKGVYTVEHSTLLNKQAAYNLAETISRTIKDLQKG